MSSSWLANFKVKKMGSKESSVGVTFGPNWSGRQVGLCLAGAAVYAAFAAVIPQMGWPLSAMAVTLTGMGVLKGQAARKQMQFENALFRGHKRWMPFEKMQKISARGCGRIWIGFGFGWDVSHCQSEAEISKSDWREAYQKSLNNALCRRYLMGHFWEALAHPVATMNQVAVMRRMVSDSPGYRWIHALGKEQPQYLSKRDLEGHLAIFGTTGAGKSRLLECLIVQAILRHETVFVVDPKGDKGLENSVRTAVLRAGRNDDFLQFHLGHPEDSINLNLLANYSRTSEVASRIADTLPGQGGDGQVFVEFGREAVRTIYDGLELLGQKPTFSKLHHYMLNRRELAFLALERFLRGTVSNESIDEKLRAEKTQDGKYDGLVDLYQASGIQSHALDGLISFADQDDASFKKMTMSMLARLSTLSRGDLGGKLSPESDAEPSFYDTQKMIRRNAVCYIGLDALTDSAMARAIGTLFLADLAATAGSRYNFEAASTPVAVFVDEAAELTSEPFTQMLNKSRGAGFSIVLASQTVSDFVARARDRAEALRILANLNGFICLRCNDIETQDFFVNRLAKVRIKTRMKAHGVSTSASQLTAVGGTVSERVSEEESDLVPSALIGALPNCEYFATYGGHVIKGRVPILLEEESQYREVL